MTLPILIVSNAIQHVDFILTLVHSVLESTVMRSCSSNSLSNSSLRKTASARVQPRQIASTAAQCMSIEVKAALKSHPKQHQNWILEVIFKV